MIIETICSGTAREDSRGCAAFHFIKILCSLTICTKKYAISGLKKYEIDKINQYAI